MSIRGRAFPRFLHSFATVLALAGWSTGAAANPPLANPSFEIVGPLGSPVVSVGIGGQSAADAWAVFHNTTPATTTTQLEPTTLAGAGSSMICVTTDGALNGIHQETGSPGSGPLNGVGAGWVLVRGGTVGMGTGNHGNTGIDAQTSAVGAWVYLQAPNGQSPINQIIFYSVGGPAEFCVEEAQMIEAQEPTAFVPVEYSNDVDEQAIPGGGAHAGPDAGQTLYTEPVDAVADSNPIDGTDFFPGIEDYEPDAQVDALAFGMDFGFYGVEADVLPLVVSLSGDPGVEPVAVFREDLDGTAGVHWTQRDLHALDPLGAEIEDVDAIELWGGTLPGDLDANFYSLQYDFGASVWYDDGNGPVAYLTPNDIVSALGQLGFPGNADDVDVDGLMVSDTGELGTWDSFDAVIFSVRPFDVWDGGEIVVWERGQAPYFLVHGGHTWDTSFQVAALFGADASHENVDAIETVMLPEPGFASAFACGFGLLGALHRWRGISAPNAGARSAPRPTRGRRAVRCGGRAGR